MARDPDKRRAYNAEYRRKNFKKIKARREVYQKENIEFIRKRGRDRYQKHKKKLLRAAKNYYHRKREVIGIRSKAAHRSDPRIAMFKAAQIRAKKRGIAFTIGVEDIIIPTHCPVFGIPIIVGDGSRCHGSPSLDRRDPKGPYSPDNCRVISFRANTVKNDGTIAEHERILAYMRGEL